MKLIIFPAAAFQFSICFWKGSKSGKTKAVNPVLSFHEIYPAPLPIPAAA